MKKIWINCVEHNIPFHVLAGISIVLIVASWLWPPVAVIDSSVIAATGEIIGWGALYVLLRAIEKGKTATVTHNNTSITVGGQKEG